MGPAETDSNNRKISFLSAGHTWRERIYRYVNTDFRHSQHLGPMYVAVNVRAKSFEIFDIFPSGKFYFKLYNFSVIMNTWCAMVCNYSVFLS